MEKPFIISGTLAAFSLLADATVSVSPLDGWGNLTALGILAVVVIFIVTKMLPTLHNSIMDSQKHAETENTARNKIFAETLEKISDRLHQDSLAQQAALNRMASKPCQMEHSNEE